jgi:hypothetical protein
MGIAIGPEVFFSESFHDLRSPVLFGSEDDDLPPSNPTLARRYAAMSDEELLSEVALLAQPRLVQ